MSIEQLKSELRELPSEERRQFAQWFYNHEDEIVESGEKADLDAEVRDHILQRRQDINTQPGLAVPVRDEWFEQLKEKLADARTAQAPAR
jgi:hypothetical protein